MFVDFAINSTGDLVFKYNKNINKPFHIMFNQTTTKSQKVSFSIKETNLSMPISKTALKINFVIKDMENKLANDINYDFETLLQLIRLQLKTVLGEEEYRTENGSLLCTFIHSDINSDNIKALNEYLTEFLNDYISNPTVEIIPYINYKNNYEQTLKVNVYSNDILTFKFNIGE